MKRSTAGTPRKAGTAVAMVFVMAGAVVVSLTSGGQDVVLPAIPGATQHRYSQAWICEHGTIKIRAYPRGMESRTGFERDHLIPLSVGGDPRSPDNVWYEPIEQAHKSDRIEVREWREVCAGKETQAQGQADVLDFKRQYG